MDTGRARFQDLREEEKKNWRIIVDESNRIDGRLIEKRVMKIMKDDNRMV